MTHVVWRKRRHGGVTDVNPAKGPAILTEYDALNPALCGQAVGATRNSVKSP
jgi:hypothetical protein